MLVNREDFYLSCRKKRITYRNKNSSTPLSRFNKSIFCYWCYLAGCNNNVNERKSSREIAFIKHRKALFIAIMGGMIYFKLKFLLPDLYFTQWFIYKKERREAFCDCLFFNKQSRSTNTIPLPPSSTYTQ